MAVTRARFFRDQDMTGVVITRDVLRTLRLAPRMIDYLRQADRTGDGKYVLGTNYRYRWTLQALVDRQMTDRSERHGAVLSDFGERVRQQLIADGVIVLQEGDQK